jgi:hypothetical protein
MEGMMEGMPKLPLHILLKIVGYAHLMWTGRLMNRKFSKMVLWEQKAWKLGYELQFVQIDYEWKRLALKTSRECVEWCAMCAEHNNAQKVRLPCHCRRNEFEDGK